MVRQWISPSMLTVILSVCQLWTISKSYKQCLGEVTVTRVFLENFSSPIAAASIAQVHKAQIDDNGIIKDSRIVCGAVQCTPRRVVNAENAIRGRVKSEETAKIASDVATSGAKALAHNGFKIPLMRNLVKRAISA